MTTMVTQDLPTWVPDELRDERKYKVVWDSRTGGEEDLQFQRLSDGAVLSFTIRKTDDPDKQFPGRNAVVTLWPEPSDRYPLGVNCEIRVTPSHFDILVADGRELLDFKTWSPIVGTGTERRQRGDDFSPDEAFFVQLVRTALARYASRRAGSVSTIQVGGQSVDSFIAKETGVQYVELAKYLSAKGRELNRNNTFRRYSYSNGSKSVVALLGTAKIKRGTTWVRMPDVPMEMDGRIWLPLAAVE